MFQEHYAISRFYCKNEVIFMLIECKRLESKLYRAQCFTYLHTKQFNVSLLLETHSTKDVETA